MPIILHLLGKLLFEGFGRLKITLTITFLGFIIDILMTSWMLSSSNAYYESNAMLLPQIGLPLMVLNYLIMDHFIPRTTFFDNVFYALSLMQWSGPVQNLLVLLNLIQGINYFYALPFMLIGSFAAVNFVRELV